MANSGAVTIDRNGRQYGAAYTVSNGMLHLKTHTETRSLELDGKNPETLAQEALREIVDAQPDA